jgi:putative PIN family toxin of toxin-antitoxin system
MKKYFSPVQKVEFFDLFCEVIEFVNITTRLNICRDFKDNYLLSLSIDSQSDYLITGDFDLLTLRQIGKTSILSFRDFEKMAITL